MKLIRHLMKTRADQLHRDETEGKRCLKPLDSSPFWHLQSLSLFKTLPESACQLLNQNAAVHSYKRRETIILEEDQRVYIITEGGFKLVRISPMGRKFIEGILERGDIVGRLTHTSGPQKQQHVIETLETTKLLCVKNTVFLQILKQHPDFSYRIMQRVEDKEQEVQKRIESLVFKSVEARLIETLTGLIKEVGRPCEHGFAVDLRLTQQDLADLVGASREKINRILRSLASDLFIVKRGRYLCVPNVERLQNLNDAQEF